MAVNNRAVWKFPVSPHWASVEIVMPEGAKFLHVGQQDNTPMVWFHVDPDAEPEPRRFATIATGQRLDDAVVERLTYLGTAICGPLVWHIFEDTGP